MAQNSLQLRTLKLINAIYNARLDFSLSLWQLLILLPYLALSLILSAIWAGALTPVFTTSSSINSISIPSYSNSSLLTAGLSFVDNGIITQTTRLGTFTFMPETHFQGFILNNAQQAFNPSTNVSAHQKFDASGYLYSTRSFGVGSSAGLTDSITESVTSYNFSENGLRARVNCIYNDSTQYRLEPLRTPSGWRLHVYNAVGFLPNSVKSIYAAAGLGDSEVTAVAGGSNNGTHYVAFATMPSTNYPWLSKMQCQVFYEPTRFLVRVNVTDKSIAVQPGSIAAVQIPNQDMLAAIATYKIGHLGSIFSSTQFTSVIGDTLNRNIQAVTDARGGGNATALTGVSVALESMLDSFLEALSSAQLQIARSSESTDVQIQSLAVVFGRESYIYAVFAVTLAVTLLYLGELGWTKAWVNAPIFDFGKIEQVIIASSNGGSNLAEKCRQMAEEGSIAQMTVTLIDQEKSSALVLLTDDSNPQGLVHESCDIEDPDEL